MSRMEERLNILRDYVNNQLGKEEFTMREFVDDCFKIIDVKPIHKILIGRLIKKLGTMERIQRATGERIYRTIKPRHDGQNLW